MSASITARSLSEAIGQATRTSKFCVAGSLPVVDPGIEVDGLGAIKLPLKRRSGEGTRRASVRSHRTGRGRRRWSIKRCGTRLNSIRRSFASAQKWNSAVAEAARVAGGQLGLPAEQVEARLYKLLVYEKGGFFLPHRDSEKHDRHGGEHDRRACQSV